MTVGMVDYGVGNLHSLAKALEAGGARVRLEREPIRAFHSDAVVLPGVGAFAPASAALMSARPEIRAELARGFPCLGICLGMQLLFDASEEGMGPGLGILPGAVRRLAARRVPHMGWNQVDATSPDPLLSGAAPMLAYFANSYVAEPADPSMVIATTEYQGIRFPAAVRLGNVWGVQFHPEKSAAAGLAVIGNFLRTAGRWRP